MPKYHTAVKFPLHFYFTAPFWKITIVTLQSVNEQSKHENINSNIKNQPNMTPKPIKHENTNSREYQLKNFDTPYDIVYFELFDLVINALQNDCAIYPKKTR